jgi:uncharacterized membrane protein YdjX (TVP38/TMEM64 family)
MLKTQTKKITKKNLKILIVVLSIILIGLLVRFGFFDLLTLENLRANQEILLDFKNQNYTLTVLLYCIVYIVVITFALPGAAILTLTGGFIFGLLGLLWVLISASIGGTLSAILSRFLFRDTLQTKFKKQLEVFNEKINQNAISYLLSLRLLPIFPFFLVNVLAGLSKIPMRTIFLTTFFGIIPGSLAYINAGKEISKLTNTGDILSPSLIFGFVFLGLLALAPSLISKKKKK